MPQRADYEKYLGKKINLITLIKEVEPVIESHFIRNGKIVLSKRRMCLCKCDCGKIWEVSFRYIISGKTKSCGCYNAKIKKERIIHGQSRRGKATKEFKAWVGMISRCTYESNKCFKHYGGRGISVCERWKSNFINFFNDMGPLPSQKHSIERIDVNGNYEPTNCKWALMEEQRMNKRTSVTFEIDGKKYSLRELSEKYNIPFYRLKNRIYKKMPITKAISL